MLVITFHILIHQYLEYDNKTMPANQEKTGTNLSFFKKEFQKFLMCDLFQVIAAKHAIRMKLISNTNFLQFNIVQMDFIFLEYS